MKKKFKCGHRGLGKFCHRCDQATDLLDLSKKEKDSGRAAALKAKAEYLFALPQDKQAAQPIPADNFTNLTAQSLR